MYKILCNVKSKDFKNMLQDALFSYSLEYDINFFNGRLCEFEAKKFEEYNKFIIDEEDFGQQEIIQRLVTSKGQKSIIAITNSINSVSNKQILLTGILTHFVDSPIYSLLNKLEGLSSIEIAKETLKEKASFNKQKLIVISSASGGVGKTTIAINLADILAAKNKKVLLIDMSVYSDFAAKLQLKHNNGLNNFIASLIQNNENGEIDKTLLNNFVYKQLMKNYSFDILYGLTSLRAEKITANVINIFIRIISQHEYDYVIFDTDSFMTEVNLALIDCSDHIVLVSVPDVGCGWKLIQQKELYEYIQSVNKCSLVINKFTKKSGFSCKQLEREIQYPLIGIVPYSSQIALESNNGRLFSNSSATEFKTYINYIANAFEPIFSKTELKIKKSVYS